MLSTSEPATQIFLSGLKCVILLMSKVHAISYIVTSKCGWHTFDHVPIVFGCDVLFGYALLLSNDVFFHMERYWLVWTSVLLSLVSILWINPEVLWQNPTSWLYLVVDKLRNVIIWIFCFKLLVFWENVSIQFICENFLFEFAFTHQMFSWL